MSTLKDVAERCGVSIATVSYCINGTKGVSAATRERIMTAIKELNYVPNTSARTLKTMNTKELGIIFPDIDDFCYSEILKGIVSEINASDYSLNIAFSYNTPKLESRIIEDFIGKNCSGLILITCQPQNTEFFHRYIVEHNLPTVFIERFPENIDANFLSFDNYGTLYYLTKKLLSKGYRKIGLLCGFSDYFSENECIRGFSDAHDDCQCAFEPGQIIETVISKEAAFRQSMYRIVQDPPQAIISSSESLTKGLMEAFNLCRISVPSQVCVITLGEECWNETNYLPNILHTSRTAYLLGQQSYKTLIRNIKSPDFFEKDFLLFKDNVVDSHLPIPPFTDRKITVKSPKRILKVLSPVDLPTIFSTFAIAAEFEKEHDIKIEYDLCNYRDLFKAIDKSADQDTCDYDLYLFDVSWLEYMGRKGVFSDITDFIEGNENIQHHLLQKNLENCRYKGRHIGFPISGGSQILFYRRDLFDNPVLRRQFESMHNMPLQAPRNWAEFNGIARFFTKEYNPYSPTETGTCVTGSINEEIALELFIRMWSFGGGLYDRRGKIILDTPPNVKGFQCMLESCRYAQKGIMETSIAQSFQAFGAGKTAMLISYMENASQINHFIRNDIVSRVDYAIVPGRTPANVGWNLGMSKHTKHSKLITEFFEWLCQKRTSYYMTTLNGQSVVTYPYSNHEIMTLYPWMKLTKESQGYSRDRIYPCAGANRLIPPYEVETLLSDIFIDIYKNNADIHEALHEGQKKLLAMLR